jgi:hypothetical protein
LRWGGLRRSLGVALAAGRVGAVLRCDAATELALQIRASLDAAGDRGDRGDGSSPINTE